MTNFYIEITADTICPWCYLTKIRLDRAIEIYKRVMPWAADDEFVIAWHPFSLDPTLPKDGVDPTMHLEKRFGHERVAFATALLGVVGQGEGINFTLAGKIGPTRDAHRLIQLAKSKSSDMENRLVTELFKAHFEDGRDITSREMLVSAAERAGLHGYEAESWLKTDKGGDIVDREFRQAALKGIRNVPDINIDNSYKLSGIQDTRTFLEVFLRVKKASEWKSIPQPGGASWMGKEVTPTST
ncbi:Thioredoxin-like fold [Rhypophila sp. PSN 637]